MVDVTTTQQPHLTGYQLLMKTNSLLNHVLRHWRLVIWRLVFRVAPSADVNTNQQVIHQAHAISEPNLGSQEMLQIRMHTYLQLINKKNYFFYSKKNYLVFCPSQPLLFLCSVHFSHFISFYFTFFFCFNATSLMTVVWSRFCLLLGLASCFGICTEENNVDGFLHHRLFLGIFVGVWILFHFIICVLCN